MIVVCVDDRSDRLPERFLIRSEGVVRTTLALDRGHEYTVDAMAFTFYGMEFLIDDSDDLNPNWHPIERFEIVDAQLPPHWKFREVEGKSLVFAFWGYESLIEDQNHFEDMIERRRPARDAYERDRGPRYHILKREDSGQ